MLTPAIPNWLDEKLWAGLHFEDIVTSAKKWVAYLKKNEKPDIIIGLFHSGWEGGIKTDQYSEDSRWMVSTSFSSATTTMHEKLLKKDRTATMCSVLTLRLTHRT